MIRESGTTKVHRSGPIMHILATVLNVNHRQPYRKTRTGDPFLLFYSSTNAFYKLLFY